MLRYVDAVVTFAEVPDEVNLCISISNCPNHCPACHSKYLWDDIGEELTEQTLFNLIHQNRGITCVCLMGGDGEPDTVLDLLFAVKNGTELKTCWYSGRTQRYWEKEGLFPENYECLNYVKFGPYEESSGGLDKETTNQRMYEIDSSEPSGFIMEDITHLFWERRKNKI